MQYRTLGRTGVDVSQIGFGGAGVGLTNYLATWNPRAEKETQTQEDLARVLNVSVRTIKRDCAELQAAGIYLPTRGNLQGIGRGQTHKGQIVSRWLQGGTYDQISRQTHHSVASVGRYIQGFAQVMQLHRQDFPVEEIALLLHMGQALVQEYLAVYDENDSALARQRLDEQLERLRNRSRSEKKGAA